MDTIKKNTDTLIDTNKKVDLELNTQLSSYQLAFLIKCTYLKVKSISRQNYWGSLMCLMCKGSTTDQCFSTCQIMEEKWK
jgi:hypothetical protein